MLIEGLVIGFLDIGVGDEAEAHLVDAKSGPPLVARAKAFGQNGQRLSFRLGRLRARIGDIGGRASIARKRDLFVIFLGFYGEIFPRQLQPGIAIFFVEQRR